MDSSAPHLYLSTGTPVSPQSTPHPPSLSTNTHGRVTAGVDGLREMDRARNEISMLNTPAWGFSVIWSEHTGFSQITQRETEVHVEIFLPPPTLLSLTTALPGWRCLATLR